MYNFLKRKINRVTVIFHTRVLLFTFFFYNLLYVYNAYVAWSNIPNILVTLGFSLLQDCVKYLALLFALLSVSMVTMADDSSEENDGDENEVEEVEDEEVTATEATVPVLRAPPTFSTTIRQSGSGSVAATVSQNGGSNVVVTSYRESKPSKTAAKAKAAASKIAKKVNRIVSVHRQRFTFYRCQTSCLVSAISCLRTCRTEGSYTFYRNQYMVCGRKCRINQYRCNKNCSNDLRRVRTAELRHLRS